VIVWLATFKLAVLKLAVVVPPLVPSVPWPMLVPPSEKMTTPVGVPGALALTVAVKVTFWPHTEGLAEEMIVVVVFPLPTVWAKLAVLDKKFPSPL
jgi:hypothetical protein